MSGLLALLGPNMTQEELDWLRRLFDRFDADERLTWTSSQSSPQRLPGARRDQSVVQEFKADVDGSGTIDFPEFAKMHVDMRDNDVDPRFDEACRMFDFFDADKSGELDPDEFLCLLNQVFLEAARRTRRALSSNSPKPTRRLGRHLLPRVHRVLRPAQAAVRRVREAAAALWPHARGNCSGGGAAAC